jgi:hypothetical protein
LSKNIPEFAKINEKQKYEKQIDKNNWIKKWICNIL